MMLIQVIGGPMVGYQEFTFPDGQRHITLTADVNDSEVWVTASVTDADSLFDLLLLKDVLTYNRNKVHLRLNYLMGGRMDRRINYRQPFTLKVVADVINAAGFECVQLLDPHSDASVDLLAADVVYPMAEVRAVLADYDPKDTMIIIPDDGATERVREMLGGTAFPYVQCHKVRDEQTGELSDFAIGKWNLEAPRVEGKRCLIIDDICDGGGTFVELAKELRKAGAVSVDLFVTHGIFSKGLGLDGIDHVRFTGSFSGTVHQKPRGTRTFEDRRITRDGRARR